jgi:hypothetical protein
MAELPPLLTALIRDNRLCPACIAARVALGPDAVATALTVLARAINIRRESGVCQRCKVPGTVYFIRCSEP